MLASFLPGLRDVRTPLTVGYMWLTISWMIFDDSIRESLGREHVAELVEFGAFAGDAALFAAVSLIAYLVGSLVVLSPDNAVVRVLLVAVSTLLNVGTYKGDPTISQYHKLVDVEYEKVKQIREGVVKNLSAGGSEAESAMLQIASQREVVNLRHRLLVANADLYGEYDRLTAEAEFRINIAGPLLVLTALISVDFGWWLLLIGIAISVGLMLRGIVRLGQARLTIMNAAVNKVFVHPAIEIAEQFTLTGRSSENLVW